VVFIGFESIIVRQQGTRIGHIRWEHSFQQRPEALVGRASLKVTDQVAFQEFSGGSAQSTVAFFFF
jgi:hypothetical protein